jgi:hypothetical protein
MPRNFVRILLCEIFSEEFFASGILYSAEFLNQRNSVPGGIPPNLCRSIQCNYVIYQSFSKI